MKTGKKSAIRAVTYQEVRAEESGQRLDNYLFRHCKGVPKSHIYRILRSGEVRINKKRAAADYRVQAGDTLRLPPLRVAEREHGDISSVPAIDLPVLYEDAALLVIDKPAGIAVHGGSGVSLGVIETLRRQRPEARFLELAHRLDKETSGLL
ncbi:MAG: RNA pseudouridine synthase, partial [Zoogloeaceae bacterium]|nr:RNA pseudouridine synthase [Zoogloeaceae bacterium]